MNDYASDLLLLPWDEPDDREEIGYWKFLIVDDDRDIHQVTKLVLEGYTFEGRKLQFLSAYSAAEAIVLLERHPDIALVLLDVVMETEDAGLTLVRHVRNAMGNELVRIILRTGQPGQAPEHSVIRDYDISDYKEKTELTSTKLYSAVYASLRTYRHLSGIIADKETLERLVRERTRELEAQALELQASIRQAYEAMMEVSVLEERNRIARDIHDVVGHTLTAAVVQLEAGICLIGIDASKAADKFALAGQLVRKGLNDIRSSVYQLAEEREPVDLRRELERIIRETEAHAGVAVECSIGPLPQLTFYQAKLICRALQEGLTNGIRHGASSRFRFELVSNGGRLDFALRNNGSAPSGVRFGYGLGGLRNQIELALGHLILQPAGTEGMELLIRLPVTGMELEA